MRTSTRVIAACALGLPVLFGMSGVAAASSMEGGKHRPAHQHERVDQDQDNKTEESNSNKQPIYQINVGDKGHQNASAFNKQENENKTDQDEQAGDD